MPHQCLKCGQLFPDGSAQILRGCPECRGTRFFYTEEAMAEAERTRLLEQGERELRSALGDLAPSERPARAAEPEPAGHAAVWEPQVPAPPKPAEATLLPGNRLLIRMRRRRLVKRLREAEASRGWDYEAPTAPEAAAGVEAPQGPRPATRSEAASAPAEASLERPGPEPAASAAWPPAQVQDARDVRRVERVRYEGEEAAAREAPEEEAPEAPPGPSDAAPPVVSLEAVAPDEAAPETVRIDGPGQYAIDVKRLLEEAPIVVQKDGSYVIHLPSLFESGQGGRRKA